MKLSFGASALGLLLTSTVGEAAFSVTVSGSGPINRFSVIEEPSLPNMLAWYGYKDQGELRPGDVGSSNTPNDLNGKGMENYNSGRIGIAAVQTQQPGTSIAVIYDAPHDGSAGTAQVMVTCEGKCPNYGKSSFIAARDDPFAIQHDPFLREDLQYDAATNSYKTGLQWDKCCTDGYATVGIADGDKVCITAVGGVGASLPKGFYFYEKTEGVYTGASIASEKTMYGERVCITTTVPSVNGDPHFKTWSGEKYDFHGVCDLVLLSSPSFKDNLGMDIHIRTEKTWIGSYVKSVAIRIGKDTLEVMGGKDQNNYWINGAKGEESIASEVLSNTIAGYSIEFQQLCEKSREFVVDLGEETMIHIKTWNDMVKISISGAKSQDFEGSLGLLGEFGTGMKKARDGATVLDDANKFGLEWQVLPNETNLFHNMEGPQAQNECPVPTSSEIRRRLGRSLISEEDAKKSCAHVGVEEFDMCVFDVMSTNDHDTAGAY